MSKKVDPLPHYWICDACATDRGGKIPPGSCNTMCMGKCEYCKKKDMMLTPIVDFKWPGGSDPVWD